MDKETIALKPKSPKRKSRYNIYVFLICLFFSTLIWFFIQLSKDYELELAVGIDYINVPKDKFIVKADTAIDIKIKVNGFKLLLGKIPKKQRIKVNLADVSFKKVSNTQMTGSVEIKNFIQNLITSKIPFIEKIEAISPEKISLDLDNAFIKKVPVKAVYSYALDKQYFIYGAIRIQPDSVLVSGQKSNVEKIRYIETDSMAFGNLKEPFESSLKLKSEGIFSYNLSQKNVKINIPVEKFTEMELNVPIYIPEYKTVKHIKIFPENARLTVMVALKDYHNISAGMFKVVVDTVDMNKKTTLPLILDEAPQYVKVNKISPEMVEYINIK